MKKNRYFLIFFVLFLSFVFVAISLNSSNYQKIKEIKYNTVSHPEFLPKKEFLKISSFWFSNVRADFYRIQAIQYIGSNVIWAEYKKYLYAMIDIISDLNPYFEHPYIIWELLLPDYNDRYENRTKEEQEENINQALNIWLKWVKNFCDKDKLEAIKWEYNLQNLWTKDKYKNPCKSWEIPYYLAYIYYFYLHDGISRAYYYKVTSANTDSIEWAKIMAAIMQGKWWDREKSIIMFLNMAKTVENNKLCAQYSSELEQILLWVFTGKYSIDWTFIKQVDEKRKLIEEALSSWKKLDSLDDTKCISYINKSVREINLYYLDQANKNYFKDKWENAINAKTLYDSKYINYLPKDFQKQEKSWREIIYTFDKDTWNFDYKFGNY